MHTQEDLKSPSKLVIDKENAFQDKNKEAQSALTKKVGVTLQEHVGGKQQVHNKCVESFREKYSDLNIGHSLSLFEGAESQT